jgi:diaminohydroxyphosphoribosylaminopyrimidine deaminase/5-amino-6-(5-phosphoribosylamino)uracil reductase
LAGGRGTSVPALPCAGAGRTIAAMSTASPLPTDDSLSATLAHWLAAHRERCSRAARPAVTLAWAQSWDGSIALHAGKALALSNPRALRLTHQLRSLHDGILVGIGTVLADDPQLTVRECPGPSPQPIVLDSQLRMPPTARLCAPGQRRCWVLSHDSVRAERADIDVIRLTGNARGHLDLADVLQALRQRGIRSLMVEGGANVITAFLQAGLADALVLTVAPVFAGGYKAVGNLGHMARAQLPRIHALQTQRLDDDLIVWGDLAFSPQAAGVAP